VISTATNAVVDSPIPVGTLPVGVAITPNGQFAYVTNNSSNSVSMINTATNTVVGSPIAVGTMPEGVAITPNGQFAYVANTGSVPPGEPGDTVSVINTATNLVISTITVGNHPFGIAITPDGKLAYVANDASNNVSVINTATNQLVGSPIQVGSSPFVFGSFIGPNIIVARGGPLLVANDAALTTLGFGNPGLGFQTFVDFNGGTCKPLEA
jgi:YVTN family beta-propeller protein